RAALWHFQLVGGMALDVLAAHLAGLGRAAVMLPAARRQALLAGIGELQIVAVPAIEHRDADRAIAAGPEAPLDQEVGGQRVDRIARRRGAGGRRGRDFADAAFPWAFRRAFGWPGRAAGGDRA